MCPANKNKKLSTYELIASGQQDQQTFQRTK